MNLDDYISNREQEMNEVANNIKKLKRWVTFFYNIDIYNSIPEEKLSLIRDFGKYIKSYRRNSVSVKNLSCFHNRVEDYMLLQVATTDNNSMLAMIEKKEPYYYRYLGSWYDEEKMTEETYNRYLIEQNPNTVSGYQRRLKDKDISPKEYCKRIHEFQLVGSQEFAALLLRNIDYEGMQNGFESQRNYYAFYSSDGKIFMGESLAEYLANNIPTPTLGSYLADEAIKIKQKKYPYE